MSTIHVHTEFSEYRSVMGFSDFNSKVMILLHFRRHPHASIEPNNRTVQHWILNPFFHHPRKFLRLAGSQRKLHDPGQTSPHFLAHQGRHTTIEKARRDGDHPDPIPSQVSRQRQRQARYGSFTCRIRYLARLSIETATLL